MDQAVWMTRNNPLKVNILFLPWCLQQCVMVSKECETDVAVHCSCCVTIKWCQNNVTVSSALAFLSSVMSPCCALCQ